TGTGVQKDKNPQNLNAQIYKNDIFAFIGKYSRLLNLELKFHIDEGFLEDCILMYDDILNSIPYTNEDLASIILKIINKFFKVVPNKFKSNFIIKNLFDDETAYYIIEILMNHFNYMPNDFRNFLSFNLLKLDLPYESLSYTLTENFFKFPDSIKERIIEFFENKNEKNY
ncbi:unnamed protein product, partial [marine sediment metagenome]